ncbi:MAG: ZIP family metal transporter [Bacillota bacterium]
MQSILYSFLAGLSTVLGSIILLIFGTPGKRIMSVLLGFAGGIMLAISLFELLPESMHLGNLVTSLVGFALGSALMFGVDSLLPHAHMSKGNALHIENPTTKNGYCKISYKRTGYLILIGITLHNIPEGLAIGAGLEASPELGLAIAVAIGLHNIPEGLAIAGPLKASGMQTWKVIAYSLIAGLTLVVGTGIGLLIINISPVLIGVSLSFAAGAMVYIVIDDLLPQSYKLHQHLSILGVILGLMLGFVLF